MTEADSVHSTPPLNSSVIPLTAGRGAAVFPNLLCTHPVTSRMKRPPLTLLRPRRAHPPRWSVSPEHRFPPPEDDTDRERAEAYFELELILCDCLNMATIARHLVGGPDRKLAEFAVHHAADMLEDLRKRYYAWGAMRDDEISDKAEIAIATATQLRARERLARDGAESRPAMQRPIQALAAERGIPVRAYQAVAQPRQHSCDCGLLRQAQRERRPAALR